MLSTRVYGVNKFNSFQFIDDEFVEQTTYRPNSNFNVGFGANYRGLGLNLGFTLPALNDDDDEFGETEYLNFSANMYLRKVTATAFFEYYNGYYVSSDNSLGRPDGDKALTIRPDVKFFVIGVSGVYVFNFDKVSFRASFTQDEWQKKSAGSFLAGGYADLTHVTSDSGLVKQSFVDQNQLPQVTNFRSLDIGPTLGYMYNFVFKKHWFITLQLSTGFGYNRLYLHAGKSTQDRYSNNLNYRIQGRGAIGYNSRLFYVGITNTLDYNRIYVDPGHIGYDMGQFRINFVYRFGIKSMGFVDKLMDEFNWFFMPRDAVQYH
jgi:hypothetical protein